MWQEFLHLFLIGFFGGIGFALANWVMGKILK